MLTLRATLTLLTYNMFWSTKLPTLGWTEMCSNIPELLAEDLGKRTEAAQQL